MNASPQSQRLRKPATLLLVLISTSVQAAPSEQSVKPDEIERIQVTTQKRLTDIHAINAAVTALTQSEIMALGIDDLQSAVQHLPGVSLTQPLRNRATLSIRGINTDIGETQLTQDPVGLYLNDMPVMGTYAEIVQPDISLFDVKRIEVARGPQGTLYGAGNIGGAVRIITNSPDTTAVDATARVDLATTDGAGQRRRYDAMLNLPLDKKTLAFRVVASSRNADGWVENIRLGGHNDYQEQQYRGALLWLPGDALKVELNALHIDSEPHDGDSWNPALGTFTRATAIRDPRVYDMQLYQLRIEYHLPDLGHVISSTNTRHTDANWHGDLGPIEGIGDFVNQSDFNTDALTQEFRFQSDADPAGQWTAGVYLYNSQASGQYALNVLGLADFVSMLLPEQETSDAFFFGESDYTMRERAIFADATLSLWPDWEVAFGARYFTTAVDYLQQEQQAFDFNTLALVPAPDFSNQVDDHGVMWRTALGYAPSDAQRYYLSLSKGVRAGQTNPNFGPSYVDPSDVIIDAGYQSDSLYTLEAGSKLALYDNRMHLNIALFYSHWYDIQVDALRLSDTSNYIANAGDAVSRGLELDWRTLLGQYAEGYLALTWQNAEIDSISAQQSFLSGAVQGDALPGTPDITVNAGLAAHWQVAGKIMLSARIDASYVGESTNRFSNLSGVGIANPDFAYNAAYTYLQTSISAQFSQLRLTAYVENISNTDRIILNIGQSQPNPAISLRPRTAGLRLHYQF